MVILIINIEQSNHIFVSGKEYAKGDSRYLT